MNRRSFLALAAFAALPASQPRLLAFGDSVTLGSGASDPAHAYAALVAAGTNRRLDNRAVGGSRIAEQVEHIRAAAVTTTDMVVFLAGYNDMRAGTPLDTYGALFDVALNLLRPATVTIGTCLRMTPEGYAAAGPQWNKGSDAAVDAINAVIVATAARYGYRIVNTTDAYDPRNQYDLSHPDDAGHAQIAAAMLERRLWLPMVERGY